MRTRRFGASTAIAALAALALSVPAAANTPDGFTACIGPAQSDYCTSGDSYQPGDTLWFRGSCEAALAGLTAKVQLREPGDDTWQKAGRDTVSDRGGMRWTWHTHESDANIEFYSLRWKIRRHGFSEIVTVRLIPPGA